MDEVQITFKCVMMYERIVEELISAVLTVDNVRQCRAVGSAATGATMVVPLFATTVVTCFLQPTRHSIFCVLRP